MKIYCSCCDAVQPVVIDDCRDAKTNAPFQDIVCAECRLVIASGTDISPPQRQPLTDEEIWKFWWSRPDVPDGEDDSMEAEFVAAVRRVLAAHGIKGEA